MLEPDAFTLGCIIIGTLLIAKTLGGSFISRLPLSAAMLYLAVGVAIGPWGWGLLKLDAFKNTVLLERLTEVALLISLFTAGMKLELPLKDKRWRIPVQLATVSMLLTVAAVAAAGVWLLNLPVGAAVLLGAILAPTDPVLASDVQVANPGDRDRLRFGLTGEGGLNDGTAFALVMLGLGLLGLHDLGDLFLRWWSIDVLWAAAGGLALGYAMGTLVGRAIIYLRTQRLEALGSDEFIALGLIALTYGLALLTLTYGFLAVFAAGLALRRIDEPATVVTDIVHTELSAEDQRATGSHAPAHMMRQVERFNSQLESFAEVAIVLVVGVLLASARFEPAVLWFVPLLFLVVRPVAVAVGLLGTDARPAQRRLMAWFGIRGIGSLYYLLYAISHGIDVPLARQLLSLTLAVIVTSVIAHGVSVTPLMKKYERRKASERKSH
ncbi:MAG: cation:proton antiporter [Polaromonas sp.]|jgi:NhaP-type Na+/H+ or K+/H+ antiporter